jgi:hypothetical protein
MIRSSLRRLAGNHNLVRDGILILLALGTGIGGLIFVFSIPDPFAALASRIPMLAPQDWPGSHASIGLGISSGWPWQEKREFVSILVRDAAAYPVEIEQRVIWYADSVEAAVDWNQLNTESYNEQPIVASTRGSDKPASMLFCGKRDQPEGLRECWYLAYWEHWYTEVNYRSLAEEDLPSLELHQITARVDQLLISAPDEPCYGILCTGTENDRTP